MNTGVREALSRLTIPMPVRGVSIGSRWLEGSGPTLLARSPIDGETLAEFAMADASQVDSAIDAAEEAFVSWRLVPAPQRGEFVRRFAETLRRHKSDLAAVVSREAGKIAQEALGEVQEMIDICDFAVGLSRQLYGKTIASERPGHRLTEQ
ncbi:MAG TPA: aldehyde dehydrogenase family protein, partial [Vicinamibacterales bacterium]|nr:aldehyde dehydrogenase family protein [Vicinamibacterales bacterium]